MANRILREVLASLRNFSVPVTPVYVRVNHADHRLKGLSRERGDEYQDSAKMAGIVRICGRGGCERNGAEARTAEPLSEIRDEAMVRAEFPEVLVLADEYASRPPALANVTWNAFMGTALGQASSFVSVQGGGSYLASYFGGCNEVIDFYGTSNAKAAYDPPFEPICPPGGLPELHKMAYVVDEPPRPQPPRTHKRRHPGRRRRLDEKGDDDDAQARRKLPEVQETYSITLPRLSGARVQNHREGYSLVAAVQRWATDPKCGLLGKSLG